MSTTYPCDTCGSDSATSDYCDMCGAAIVDPAAAAGPAPAEAPPESAAADGPAAEDGRSEWAASDWPDDPDEGADLAAAPPAPPEPGATCYYCGAPRDANDALCEVCGIDFISGQMPAPAEAPLPGPPGSTPPGGSPPINDITMTTVAPPAVWTAIVAADRAFFDGNITAGAVTFPDSAPREMTLMGHEISIGRQSQSKGYVPDIDLSSPVDDPAVSRRHAMLQRQPDGSLAVLDLGSTNGTWVNDEEEPLAHGVPRLLQDGDRLLLGAFSCITIRRDAPPSPSG